MHKFKIFAISLNLWILLKCVSPLAIEETMSKKVESTSENIQHYKPSITDHVRSKLEKLKNSKQTNNTNIMTFDIYEEEFHVTNAQLCPDFGAKTKLAFLITSAITNKEKRLSTRMTWGDFALRNDIVLAFFLGKTNDTKLQEDIEKENKLYGDIIVGNNMDSYRNLTLKSINMLEWVNNYCFKAEFILKTDDDVFVNVPKLLEFIDEQNDNVDNKIYGYVHHDMKVFRDTTSKYYLPFNEFPLETYMDFTDGHAYLYHKNVAKLLYEKGFEEVLLSMEDVYITGILAEKLNIPRVHVDAFHTHKIEADFCLLKSAISIHNVTKVDKFNYYFKLFGSEDIDCRKKN